MRHLVLTILVPLALTACGSDSPGGSGDPQSPQGPRGDVRIRVVQSIDPPGVLYEEGSYSYVRVIVPDGDRLFDRRLHGYPHTSAVLRLPPGDYRLVSYQRPCDGNCAYLDPPMDLCATPLHVAKGRALRVSVVVVPGDGCTTHVGTK